MNTSKLTLLVAALVLGNANALAEQAHHPDAAQGSPQSGMMGGGMMDSDMMERMQENMQKMQAQMKEIRSTKDDKTRERLMDEHMTTMQQGMDMMRNMGGSMMQGMMGGTTQKGAGMGGGMGKQGAGMPGGMSSAPGDAAARMDMMERRMDMMQMMMEQMNESRQMDRRIDRPD